MTARSRSRARDADARARRDGEGKDRDRDRGGARVAARERSVASVERAWCEIDGSMRDGS